MEMGDRGNVVVVGLWRGGEESCGGEVVEGGGELWWYNCREGVVVVMEKLLVMGVLWWGMIGEVVLNYKV